MIPPLPIPSDPPTVPIVAAVVLAWTLLFLLPLFKSALRAVITVLGVAAVAFVVAYFLELDIPLLGVF